MDFVWFYAKKFSAWHLAGQFNELDYSIRSVRKNYQGDVRCFVVGDDPGLEHAEHIPAPPLVELDEIHGQPRVKDQLNKFQVILDSEVNEEFALIWDDVYILKPTTEEELKTVYGRCEITNPREYIQTRSGGTPYKRVWVETYEHILAYRKRKGLKTYDWETHLPRVMTKTNLQWLFDNLYLKDIPKIATGLYQGYFSEETKIIPEGLQSDIYTHKAGMDFDKEFDCHYMNIGDGVIVPEFIEHMKRLFG